MWKSARKCRKTRVLASRTGAFGQVAAFVVGVGVVVEDVVDEVVVEAVDVGVVVVVGAGVGAAGVGIAGVGFVVIVAKTPPFGSPFDLVVELVFVLKEECGRRGGLKSFPSLNIFVLVVEVLFEDVVVVVLKMVDDVVFFPVGIFRDAPHKDVVLRVVEVVVLANVVRDEVTQVVVENPEGGG